MEKAPDALAAHGDGLPLHPFLTEPWASLAASCNSLAVTAALLAALLSRDRPDLPPEAFASDEDDSRSGEEAVKQGFEADL